MEEDRLAIIACENAKKEFHEAIRIYGIERSVWLKKRSAWLKKSRRRGHQHPCCDCGTSFWCKKKACDDSGRCAPCLADLDVKGE